MSVSDSSHWEEFYETTKPPKNISSIENEVKSFCLQYSSGRIALITSGGTTVPLENNTVRFVDNFSAGLRGASSAEYFLKHGYAVIFLYRDNSLQPFYRHFHSKKFLDYLETVNDDGCLGLKFKEALVPNIAKIVKEYEQFKERCYFCTFTTLTEYLWLLRLISRELSHNENKALLYLAAAVSDFYIPEHEMTEHKIQSNNGPLELRLQLVPKMLRPLVSQWIPNAFIISFKLETDENLLESKAKEALQKYKHKVVISNLLQTRRTSVKIVTLESTQLLSLDECELLRNVEIEEKIVSKIICLHDQHCSNF